MTPEQLEAAIAFLAENGYSVTKNPNGAQPREAVAAPSPDPQHWTRAEVDAMRADGSLRSKVEARYHRAPSLFAKRLPHK